MFVHGLAREIRDVLFAAHQLPRRILTKIRRSSRYSEVTSVNAAASAALHDLDVGDIWTETCGSYDEFIEKIDRNAEIWARVAAFEASLVPPGRLFDVVGYCAVCRRESVFFGDFLYSDQNLPNWRERLICRGCKLPNRDRALIDILESDLGIAPSATMYVTEQSSPLFRILAKRYPKIIGSEFLKKSGTRGRHNFLRIRNEDLTSLTLQDASVDFICTADVLEHVPEYKRAIAECFRCLKPGGAILVTVPFMLHSATTTVRAVLRGDGSVEHRLPPEYHGDPLDEQGLLCYYHFGWDLLDTLREAGFSDVSLRLYWSARRAYLGGLQFVITANKPKPGAAHS